MAETFLALLAAHLIGDFLLQSGWIIENKRRLPALLLHILIIVFLSLLLLGAWHPVIIPAIAVTHLAADFVKSRFLKDGPRAFIGDQMFHIAVIAGLAFSYPGAFAGGPLAALLGDYQPLYMQALALIAGAIVCVPVGAYFIRKLMAPLAAQLKEEDQNAGLKDGGFWIGCLERALVYIFVLSGQPQGIGLLIAAKSILRFGEIKDGDNRKLAEYIIIGTFVSFAWSLSVAGLARAAFLFWR